MSGRDDRPEANAADDTAYVTALVRAHDLPRYYATLFAPPSIRSDLLAVYGFAAEIARVPDQVREPRLGEIRLKWWGEALEEAIGSGGGGETPALRAASAAVTRLALPIAPLTALAEARSADLYADPPATLNDLEGRMGETQSALFQLAAMASGVVARESAEAAGHAGIAYGVTRRLARFASDRARGRTILSSDLLAARGVSAAQIFQEPVPAGVHDAIVALTDHARRHLRLAREHAAGLPGEGRAVFLPLAVVAPLLDRIEGAGPAIGQQDVALSDLHSLTRIGIARFRR